MDFLGIGGGEILIILLIALLLWGPNKIIEASRMLGKAMHTLRKATSDISAQVSREMEEQKKITPPSAPDKKTV
jgi:sec-independent protein translocase protein TatA